MNGVAERNSVNLIIICLILLQVIKYIHEVVPMHAAAVKSYHSKISLRSRMPNTILHSFYEIVEALQYPECVAAFVKIKMLGIKRDAFKSFIQLSSSF